MPITQTVLNEMNKQLSRIEAGLTRLSDEQIWYRLKPDLNSIGNLCVHLAGNEYQHFVSGIGGGPFNRKRSEEFTVNGGLSGTQLIRLLQDVRAESTVILAAHATDDLQSNVTIHYSVEDWNSMLKRPSYETAAHYTKTLETLLIQVCEHYSYHTGQIVLLTKLLVDSEEHITRTFH